jgi:hypothetical protein
VKGPVEAVWHSRDLQNSIEYATLWAKVLIMIISTLQKCLFIFLVCLFPGLVSAIGDEQLTDTTRNQGVKFEGLTKTLASLLKTRTPKSIFVGDYEISLENLIDDDIAAVFDCDSLIMQYLSEAGDEATYGMLSYEMSHLIESRFEYNDGYLYVNVFSDTTANGMSFNISITRGKPVSLPIVLHASDTSFSTSFDTTCMVVFNADIDLFVNAALAIADSQSRATQVRINTFTFEISSNPDEEISPYDCFNSESESADSTLIQNPPSVIPFDIEGMPYCAAARCFSIFARSFWYLSPADAGDCAVDDGISCTLTFEQIEKGDFIWEESHYSSLEAVLIMIPANEDWDSLPASENRAEFHYTVDDLFDENSLEQISLCCDYYIKDGVTARNRKYVHKP